jgi:hypothetical protein
VVDDACGIIIGGGETAPGHWATTVYLSTDPVLDGSDLLLGAVADTAVLQPAESLPESLAVSVPAWASGPFYLFARVDSRNEVYEGGAENDGVVVGHGAHVLGISEVDLGALLLERGGDRLGHFLGRTIGRGISDEHASHILIPFDSDDSALPAARPRFLLPVEGRTRR